MQDTTTPHGLYVNRRRFFQLSAALTAGTAFGLDSPAAGALDEKYLEALEALECAPDLTLPQETLTPFKNIVRYNNYYEFSPDKKAPAILAQALDTSDWHIDIGGLVKQPLRLSVAPLLARALVHRQYRLRCVEGWSMVIPWCGIPLHTILSQVDATPEARYIKFTGTYEPEAMIGQRRNALDWPYIEGLRLDEARNPLTLLALGLYDKALTKQNGAPLRLVVPWKYGFKSIKAIKKIEFVHEQPVTTWMKKAPAEYGFYANVNPSVPHPRWSQRREVRIGEVKKRRTEMFNGYAQYVEHMYEGMSLSDHF